MSRTLSDADESCTAEALERDWGTTTTDNVRAFGFYQQWEMNLRRLIHDAVEASRRLKPSTPTTVSAGIPPRHELEFELLVDRP